jgi:hypothetical protein
VFPARWEEAADQWLPYATDHLDRHWPDDLRELPLKWAARKRPPSAVQLARHLRLETSSQPALTALPGLLERARPPLTILSSVNINPLASAQLLRAGANPNLRDLQIFITSIDDASSEVLAALDGLATVELLTLNNVRINDVTLTALLSSPHLIALRQLSMYWCSGRTRDSTGATLAHAINTSGLADRLESLTLSLNRHTDPAALARGLARVRWPALTTLDLTRSGCEHMGIQALLQAAPSVRDLRLRDNQLDDHAMQAIAAAICLERLDLASSRAAPPALAGLLEQPCCAGLKALNLDRARIEAAGGAAICRGQIAQTLESLYLTGDQQGASMWPAFEGASLPKLKTLHLMGARLDGAAARALARAHLPALVEVDLSRATVDAEALDALEGAPWRAQTRQLWRYEAPKGPRRLKARITALGPQM